MLDLQLVHIILQVKAISETGLVKLKNQCPLKFGSFINKKIRMTQYLFYSIRLTFGRDQPYQLQKLLKFLFKLCKKKKKGHFRFSRIFPTTLNEPRRRRKKKNNREDLK